LIKRELRGDLKLNGFFGSILSPQNDTLTQNRHSAPEHSEYGKSRAVPSPNRRGAG